MKVIIAGSRTITDYGLLVLAINRSCFDVTEIISGGAQGVDKMGERYAKEHGILLTIFPADWYKNGKAAGHIRNQEMADYAAPDGALLALWDGTSSGTKNMIDTAKKVGLEYYVISLP